MDFGTMMSWLRDEEGMGSLIGYLGKFYDAAESLTSGGATHVPPPAPAERLDPAQLKEKYIFALFHEIKTCLAAQLGVRPEAIQWWTTFRQVGLTGPSLRSFLSIFDLAAYRERGVSIYQLGEDHTMGDLMNFLNAYAPLE